MIYKTYNAINKAIKIHLIISSFDIKKLSNITTLFIISYESTNFK